MVFCNNNYGVRAFPDRDLNRVGLNNRFTSPIVDVSVTGSASAWRRKLIETSNIVKRQGDFPWRLGMPVSRGWIGLDTLRSAGSAHRDLRAEVTLLSAKLFSV